jgi:hypothetical protein
MNGRCTAAGKLFFAVWAKVLFIFSSRYFLQLSSIGILQWMHVREVEKNYFGVEMFWSAPNWGIG